MASVFRLAVGAMGSALRQATSLTSLTSTSTSTPSRLLSAACAPRLCCARVTPPASPAQRTITTTTTCRSLITASGTGSSSSSSSSSSLLSSSSSSSSSWWSSSRSLLQRPQCWGVLGATQSGVRGYHVRVALKKRCSGCYFVRRKGRLYVECKTKPRHKQMQVMSKRKTWKEDYSKGFIQRAVFWKYDRDHRYYKLGDTEFARHDWLKGKIGVTV